MRNKRLVSFLMVIIFILMQVGGNLAYAKGFTIAPSEDPDLEFKDNDKYGVPKLDVVLSETSGVNYLDISFEYPKILDNEKDKKTYKYLTFYTQKGRADVIKWSKGLKYHDLHGLEAKRNGYWNWSQKKFDMRLDIWKDIDGEVYDPDKSYYLYIATTENSTTLDAKVIGLNVCEISKTPVPGKELPKAPINLLKAVEKNQFLQNEEFTINYKIQPQPIQADKILPESYLKDKEIVLVMDTSGSMKEEIEYDTENNEETNNNSSIFEAKYAPRNFKADLMKSGSNYYYDIDFEEPSVGEQNNQTYLVFYSEKEIDEVETWLKNLNYNDFLNFHETYKAYWMNRKSFNLHLRTNNGRNSRDKYKDKDGKFYNKNKSYNVYVATIKDNNKVVGLSKNGSEISRQRTEQKIKVMKEVAKNFLEKFKNGEGKRIKVAVVPYSDYARDVAFNNEEFANLSDDTDYKNLTDKIDGLSADGGTNIGDGLRKAFYKFSAPSEDTRKYVILMTDGEPTFHSSTYSNDRWGYIYENQLYFENGSINNDYYYFGGGHYATEDDKLYANKVVKDLILNGGKSIESFMIAFSNGADKSELKNIANNANGYFKEAVDGNALDEVYQKLAEQIQSDLPIHGINFEETFPQGINIVGVSEGIEFNGQTVTGDIGSISYILNEETNQFEAKPFEFSITLKGTEIGNYKLGIDGDVSGTSYIDYKDIDGTEGHGNFPSVNISVYENKPPGVIASLTDHETNEAKYKLLLTVDEPSRLEISNVDGHIIWSEDKTRESASSYPKTFPIDINKFDLKGMFIKIKAVDKFNNMAEETVPLINLNPIEILGVNQNDKTIKGILDLETEMNSTVTSIKINGKIVSENRLLDDEGKYIQRVNFKEGSNEIEVTVRNQFNNSTTLKFNEVIGNKSSVTSVIRNFPNNTIMSSSEYEIVYNINGDKIQYNLEDENEDNKLFNEFYYEETFPSGVELVNYPSELTKIGTIDTGYTLSGNVSGINMKKVNGESNLYKVDGQITITIKCDAPGNYDLNSGKVIYEDPAGFEGEVLINYGNIEVIGEKLEKLSILEVQPTFDFELKQSMFTSIAEEGGINIVQMPMSQFISDIGKINGKYDIVYVGSKIGEYTNIGDRPSKLPQNTKSNGTDSLENYSEIDITNNKAKDLKEFIESGQLAIFANKAFNNEQTKLYSNFHEFNIGGNNFITTDNIIETVKTISDLYDECNKRPILTIANSPNDFTGTLDNGTSSSYIETKVMNFTFDLENLNTTGNNENSMDVKLYLDENGDGFFRDDEMVKQGEPRFNGNGYLIDYRLENYFTGMMPWKLEIEDTKTNTKAYKTGFPAYKGQKLNVRVLQLIPPGNNFNINDMKVPLNTDYYNVDVTTLTTDKFNKNYPNDIDHIKTELNGNYDMIILGFSDGFNSGDLTIKSIDAIKEFIKTGQGVMFTHDTMSYHVNNYGSQSKNLTQQFRDLIGQSRYNNSLVDDENKPEIAKTEFYSDEIGHDTLLDSNKISYGFTKAILDVKNNITSNHPQVNKTYKLNDGLFTRYPYILANNPEKQLNIATTHEQFFQLNLEDEDVIPWFTLDGGATNNSYVYDKYDGRNNYYTYTKGNITYSGTGHRTPDGNNERIDEHKMFMNTIIKAARSANHAPTLTVINLEENKIVSKSQEQFEFNFIASDIDGDALSGSIYINDNLVPSFSNRDIEQGEQVNVVITKGDLIEFVGNDEVFTVKVVVEDTEGAVAEKSTNLRYFDQPSLNMTMEGVKEYLVGDKATIKLNVVADNSSENLITEINNIDFSMEYNEEAMTIEGNRSWEELSNVIFDPQPNPRVQEKYFVFTLNEEGNYSVGNTLTYDYSNFDRNNDKNFSYPISVRSGIIDVTVLNSEGKAFESVDVTVTGPSGNVEKRTDANSKISLIDQPSGSYTFSINGLDTKYMIEGGASKTIDLSYDNNQQEIRFEIVDTSKIGLELTADGGNQYLVGDTANIDLTATAHNEDENINTTIHNIIYSMQYNSNELEVTTGDESWSLNDVQISGSHIPNNKEQSKNFRFDIKEVGDYEVINTLEYEYLDGAKGIESETHNFHVRSGRISGKVTKPDDTSYAGATIEVVNEEDTDHKYQATTDSHGIYNFVNIPSGNYSISVKVTEGDGFIDGEGNSKKVVLSFDYPEHEINIELEDNTVIIKSGMYINSDFLSNNQVVTGFDAYLATEFKVFGNQPDVRLILDKMIDKVEWRLYKIDSSGKLSVASGNKVYNDNEEKRELKIGVESTNEFNHYLLEYKVSQQAPVKTELRYHVKVNGVGDEEAEEGHLDVVPMPILD